ncbi:MAG: 1-deoxy-D-xylulose-5-phosphate reductoisomerase [Dehalococcoidia bacterium]|nr:MAG: 1-deoxy-D-xylulose-5-phosphate reductoisomerase [Chloroflexi bacterium TMED230]RZP14335.1 MAG: 1-deoxy-D-xylulose-5-phosphate reductoisomerase [Chloroflexota bacterium]
MKKIVIIGSTGSIGTQTLEICSNNNKDIEVYGLTAGKNIEKLKSQILKYKPKFYDNLEKINFEIKNTQLKDSINLVSDQNVDFILFASSGSKAYLPIVESLRSGKTVGLTNKEVIVTFGPLLFQIAKSNGAKIFPVDSEPSAIWQCIDGDSKTISKIILTASGGIFRDLDVKEYKNITTDQAKQHPNWDMGEKITVDSSTMMNKIFEIVETSYLFDIPIENIEVLIHRESLVHSMVEFLDGSIKAQISKTDMKLPIQHAIGFESKNFNYSNKLNLSDLNNLSFSEVQIGKYPCYDFALDYIKKGPLYVSALSITNEILVDLFLAEKISFVSIADLMIETLINEKFEYEITFENIIEMREILENKIFNRIKSNANNY